MVLLTNHPVPTEAIHHAESNVLLNIDGSEIGCGNLFITESCVVWLDACSMGLQLEYKLISLHAISRDLTNFPSQHLLLHYEGPLPGRDTKSGSDEEEDDDDDDGLENTEEQEGSIAEIRFIPANAASLESLFGAMSTCQTLHPDSDCQLSDDEDFEDAEEEGDAGDVGFYEGEDGTSHLTQEGRVTLEHLNNLLERGQGDTEILQRTSQMRIANGHPEPDSTDSGQFQDADSMEQ